MTLPFFPSYREIPLTQGKVAFVDEADFERIAAFRWHVGHGYAKRNVSLPCGGQTTMTMHRQVLGLQPSGGRIVDHIDGNKLDNRRANLRLCSAIENSRNRKTNENKTIKGIIRHGNKWRARIRVNQKLIHLGLFSTPEEAGQAYMRAATEHFGEFASSR